MLISFFSHRRFVAIRGVLLIAVVFLTCLIGCDIGYTQSDSGRAGMSSFDSTGGDLSRMCSDTGIVLDVDQDRSLVWIKTVEGTHSSYPDTVLLLDYSSRKGIYPVQLDDGLVAGSKVVVGYFPIEMESGGYSGTSLLRDESD